MKKLVLVMALVFCFLSVIPASAVETPAEELETRYLCDANADGAVTVADARIILRYAVGLIYTEGFGWMDYNDIIYCDANKSGAIDAADARIALRTAVNLEKAESRAFSITDYTNSSCAYEAYVKAECSLTGDTVYIKISKSPHSLSQQQKCAGSGYCAVCEENLSFTPEHDFNINTCKGVKRCVFCQYQEHFKGRHKFSSNLVCSECSESVYDEYEAFLTEFLIKNGEKVIDDSGNEVYVYEEADEYFVYGLLYFSAERTVRSYLGMAVESEGEIVYNEALFYMSGMQIEIVSFTEDTLLVNSFAKVEIPKLKNGTDNGIKVIDFWAVPELQDQQKQFGIFSSSMALMSFSWLKNFAERTDFTYSDLLFSNNPEFR